MTTPIVNITVPVFNRPELTRQTLQAVRKHTRIPHCLTVVDNGSDAETRDLLIGMKERGDIDHLFRLAKNFGVAVAANVGWRLVDAPLYMKLDNDVVMHSARWFEIVLGKMQAHPGPSVWGADLNFQLDNVNYVKEREGFQGKTHAHISGGAILIPRNVSDVLGYWCEDYGLYGCEDGDYGERLRTLSVDQFYFDHQPFMTHLGDDAGIMKDDHSLDKQKAKKAHLALWQTSKYLIDREHRSPNIPAQFVPAAFDGYALTIERNTSYLEIFKAFVEFHKTRLEHDEYSQPFLSALNNLITIQNATWDQALQSADKQYSVIRKQVENGS